MNVKKLVENIVYLQQDFIISWYAKGFKIDIEELLDFFVNSAADEYSFVDAVRESSCDLRLPSGSAAASPFNIPSLASFQRGLLKIVGENHAFNFKLWQAEDRARREDKGFEFVYLAKREIDYCNQQRNNKMEEMDIFFYDALSPASSFSCKVNSETPGMMIDRLSILSLKLYHMNLQAKREDVNKLHVEKCLNKSAIIALQKTQLEKCLIEFLEEIILKTRTFILYNQFKMYNDPELNPELYRN